MSPGNKDISGFNRRRVDLRQNLYPPHHHPDLFHRGLNPTRGLEILNRQKDQ